MDSIALHLADTDIKAIAYCLLSILIVGQGSLAALADDGFRTGLDNTNQVFTDVDMALEGSSFNLNISDGKPARIRVELVDIYANDVGAKQIAPLNSTPYSPDGYVDYKQDAGFYYPNGQTQTIKIPFEFKNLAELDRPIIGGLRISLQEMRINEIEAASGIRIDAGIVGTFTYFPSGMVTQGEYQIAPILSIQELDVSPMRSDSPNFDPFTSSISIINKGPIKITTKISNDGNIFLETVSQIQVSAFRVFSKSNERAIFQYQGEKLLLTPGQSSSNTVNVTDRIIRTDELVDPLPTFGVLRVTVGTSGTIGNKELTNVSASRTVILFPWRVTLLGFLVTVMFLLLWRGSFGVLLRQGRSYLSRRKISVDSSQEITTIGEELIIKEGRSAKTDGEQCTSNVRGTEKIVKRATSPKKKVEVSRVKAKKVSGGKVVKKAVPVGSKSSSAQRR